MSILVAAVVSFVLVDCAAGQISSPILPTADCVTYLIRFGYVERSDLPDAWLPEALWQQQNVSNNFNNNGFHPIPPPVIRKGIFDFQEYAGLRRTGLFDLDTQSKMLAPRCGNSDKVRGSQIMNVKYAPNGSKWKHRDLTYRITRYSETGISPQEVDVIIEEALEHWSNVTDLRFIRSSSKYDMDLYFARRDHKDGHAFDGKNGVLAHAFNPGTGIGGDTHFDDDEPWGRDNRPRPNERTSLLQVAVHEIGHALGLSHSDVRNAVMYAFMDLGRPNAKFLLHKDDIEGIQHLYGKRKPGGATSSKPIAGATTSRPNLDAPVDLCADPKIDAIAALYDGSIYAFKGAYAYKLDQLNSGVAPNTISNIDKIFPGLPSNIDAAVLSPNSKRTYFFKGSKYWRYNGTRPDGDGLPILISQGFPGIPNDVDAVFVWSGNNHLYFFKGKNYWLYKPGVSPPVDPKYPLPISSWGLPDDIDAAFQSPHGSTFFFKGDNYWRYEDKKFAVVDAKPPYPRSTRLMWFGCYKFRPEFEELYKDM